VTRFIRAGANTVIFWLLRSF